METAILKTFFTVAIFAAAWLGGWLPRTLETWGAGKQIMRFGNALAAGIFLGTGMIHMLGAAHNEWVDLGWTFPMAFRARTSTAIGAQRGARSFGRVSR